MKNIKPLTSVARAKNQAPLLATDLPWVALPDTLCQPLLRLTLMATATVLCTLANAPALAQALPGRIPQATSVSRPADLAAANDALRAERDKTRAAIEKTTSDQATDLDSLRSLGATRQADKNAMPDTTAPRTTPDRSRTSAAQGSVELPALDSAPVRAPLARASRRPSAPEPLLGLPVFTPDFSRQLTTLASLAGRPALDLPRGEFSPTVAPQATTAADNSPSWSLPQLVDTGLHYSPVIEQARSQLETALARSKQTRADLLPRASVRLARGPERSNVSGVSESHSTRSQSLRLTQPLIDVPALRNWMSDLSAEQAATWRVKASNENISLAITKATVDLAVARVVLDFSDDQFEQLNQILAYITTRAQAGASSQAEVERARTRVLVARQVRIEQQSAYRNALLELERLTGEKPEQLRLPFLNQLPGLPAQLADIRRLARAQSYDLQALRSDLDAQSHTVSSQYSRYLPTLGVSLERDDGTNVRGVNPRQIDNRALLVLNWDVSLGGREYFAGQAASSELANRKAKLEEETERILTGIDADFSLLRSATLRVDTGLAEQRAASAVMSAVQEQLRVGRMSGSVLEALDAFERFFAARQRLSQTLGQQMLAQAQLLRRIGLLQNLAAREDIASANTTPENAQTITGQNAPTKP